MMNVGLRFPLYLLSQCLYLFDRKEFRTEIVSVLAFTVLNVFTGINVGLRLTLYLFSQCLDVFDCAECRTEIAAVVAFTVFIYVSSS